MKEKVCLLIILGVIGMVNRSVSQSFSTDFSWLVNSPNDTSTVEVSACGDPEPLEISLITVGFEHLNGMPIPEPTTVAGDEIPIRLEFSRPVSNLRLWVIDLDDYVVNSTHSEHLDEFEDQNGNPVSVSVISSTAGSISETSGVVHPTTQNTQNNDGWIEFSTASGSLTEVSFVYNRLQGYGGLINGGLILGGLEFDCLSCVCDESSSDLVNPSKAYNSSGIASATLDVNSGSDAISKLVISVSNYDVITNLSGVCSNNLITEVDLIGKIVNTPLIQGVAPSFGSAGVFPTASNELVYTFNPAVPLNDLIDLKIFFPTSSCKRAAEYCLRTTFYDRECNACDFYSCNVSETSGAPKSTKSTDRAINRPQESGILKQNVDSGKAVIWPNPATSDNFVTIACDHSSIAKVNLINASGQIVRTEVVSNESNSKVNLHDLPSGVYVVNCLTVEGVIISSEKLIIN